MIVRPTITQLLTKANNRYELVLTDVKEESPVTLAANEIAEGTVVIEC